MQEGNRCSHSCTCRLWPAYLPWLAKDDRVVRGRSSCSPHLQGVLRRGRDGLRPMTLPRRYDIPCPLSPSFSCLTADFVYERRIIWVLERNDPGRVGSSTGV